MDLELAGKTALVTGASAGIGRGVAGCLASEGTRVALVARREPVLLQFAEELKEQGAPTPVVITGDTTDPADQARIVERAVAELGTVEILVQSAGGHRRETGLAASDEDWAETMMLNFEAQRRLAGQLVPIMRERGWGRIIGITGKSEPPRAAPAFSAKAATHAWAKGLSRELGPFGITVNSVAPGRILTEGMANRYSDDERAAHTREIPIGRYGTPQEIGRVVTFLASPAAAYVTGTVIPVDGGLRRYFL